MDKIIQMQSEKCPKNNNIWFISDKLNDQLNSTLSSIEERKKNFAYSLFVFLEFYENIKNSHLYNNIYEQLIVYFWESQIRLLDKLLSNIPFNSTQDKIGLKDFDEIERLKYLITVSKIIDLWKISYLCEFIQNKYYKYDVDFVPNKDQITNNLYKSEKVQSNICVLKLDNNKLNIFDDHFGILPAILLENEILNSWLLQCWEFVSTINAKIPIYPCDQIYLERENDEIFVKSVNQDSVIFAQISIQKISDEENEKSDELELYLDKSLVGTIDANKLLHRVNWVKNFSDSIVGDYQWINISKQASIKEYLWFIIFSNLNDEQFLENLANKFPRVKWKESLLKMLKWQFGKIKVKSISHNFEQLLDEDLQIKLLSVNIKSSEQWVLLLINAKVCAGLWQHIGTYQFSII